MNPGGFEIWSEALTLDRNSQLSESKSQFESSAKAFFDEGSLEKVGVARAMFEYSTLMDALAKVQEGRMLKSELKFEDALSSFAKASEILRATVHFAFIAGYVSGCASLETAFEMEDDDEKFQGFKNSIALFEQSKLALSFRDERHPLLRSIDAMIKFTISRALLLESEMLAIKGSLSDSRKKKQQSKDVEEDFKKLAGNEMSSQISRFRIDYFLKGYECHRALTGAFILSFPEKNTLWIGNVGKNSAQIEAVGGSGVDKMILPSESITWEMKPEFRGKLRIKYKDEETGKNYDEGCLTII